MLGKYGFSNARQHHEADKGDSSERREDVRGRTIGIRGLFLVFAILAAIVYSGSAIKG